MIQLVKPVVGIKEIDLVNEVLQSGMLAQGPKVKKFEDEFAAIAGTKYAVALNSGTAAIHAALYAAGVSSGDEVITVPFTFVATASPILMQNAKPVFVDVTKDTFTIDTSKIQEKITPKTKAIIAVDLYGQIANYEELKKITNESGILLIEDACQAVNAKLNGKSAGSFGDMGCFSFYATKNMFTGEGGMLTTDNYNFAEIAKRFRHHGQSEQYEYRHLGYNYRMTDIQAAIGLGQLGQLENMTQRRIENASLLTNGLRKIPGIKVPFVKPLMKHVYHQYTIIVDGFNLTRDELVSHLKTKNVGCGIYYPKPLHMHPIFSYLGYKEGDLPASEWLSQHVVSLPCHPSITPEDIDIITSSIKEVM